MTAPKVVVNSRLDFRVLISIAFPFEQRMASEECIASRQA
uniref:Uncharacterized protein n=1 Tax=Arundo donax TaxID=35708 RepID=A0A0A9BX66_ARUDO